MLKTANIRDLKDRLSAYLRDVQRGDVILVSDRGRVIAEIRQPLLHPQALDEAGGKVRRLVDKGVLRPGLPNSAEAYQASDVHLPAETVDRALSATRGDP